MTRHTLVPLITLTLAAPAPTTLADINDGHGRIWRELTDTTNLSWEQVATVCPTDGVTPGLGSVGGKDFTGWIWATQAQVTRLFSYYEPAILTAPSLAGSAYFLPALWFTSDFRPTYQFHIESASFQSVQGWTATDNGDGTVIHASVSARWPVFNGTWSTATRRAATIAESASGVWLFKIDPDYCPADLNGDGLVDFADYLEFLNLFDAGDPRADLNEDGLVDFADYLEFLNLYETGC